MNKYKLQDIYQHSFDLSKLILQKEISVIDPFIVKNIAHWLHLASGIHEVEFNITKLDHSDGAIEDLYKPLYEEEAKLISQVISATARFNHIWAALELLIDNYFTKRDITKYGRINIFCEYLKTKYEPQKNLILYNKHIRDLKKYIKQTSVFKENIFKALLHKKSKNVGKSGIGINIVQNIRLFFAYGSYQVPIATVGFGEKPLDAKIIDTSSRIVLLSMQMFFLTFFYDSAEKIDCWWYEKEHRRKVNIHAYLRIMHLRLSKENLE
jgi:hypothetical protein